jgi:D-alanyl-D-alanine carboxypeptidase
MNDWVQSIGAYRTYFADPSGLSPDNVSTVNDMALILDWIRLKEPEIIDITALKTKTIRAHTWVNPTHFLSWSYYIGGKNGYTTEANRTGAALFKLGKNKNVYAVIVLGSGNRDADVIKLLEKVRE